METSSEETSQSIQGISSESGGPARLTRREILQATGAGLAGVALAPAFAACGPGQAPAQVSGLGDTLNIVQWSHFVPAYDTWFDKYAQEWGAKNKVNVAVDHVPNLEVPARLAAEASARTGHDIIQFQSQFQTYRFEKLLVDVGDLVDHATKLYGNPIKLGKDTSFINGVWRAVPDFYIVIAPLIRDDLLQQIGNPKVETWDDIRKISGELKRKSNNAAGLAISHCNDANHNWRAIMWCYGASEVAKDGKTVTVNTPEMRNFLDFARGFFKDAIVPEVFAWDDVSDNRYLGSGQGSFIHDALSSLRSIEPNNKSLYESISIRPPLKGPAGVHNMPDANLYAIWEFAPHKEAAKQFLKDYYTNWKTAMRESTGYNMPFFENLFQKPMPVIGDTQDKLKILQDYKGDEVFHTIGWPGPPNAAAQQVQAEFLIPDMVATAINKSVDDAIKDFEKKINSIYRFLAR